MSSLTEATTIMKTDTTRAGEDMNLAGDMLQTFGLAAAAGIGTALASGLVVVMIALHAF